MILMILNLRYEGCKNLKHEVKCYTLKGSKNQLKRQKGIMK
jgi:hypothetical protein